MKVKTHKFSLNLRLDNDCLVDGTAAYTIDNSPDKTVDFISAEITKAIDRSGLIKDSEKLKMLSDSVLATLNNDDFLHDVLRFKD